jgi:hypothetical protein
MSSLPKKKDPSITFLNKFGYNVIRLPRTGIEPMDVIGHAGEGKGATTERLGSLDSLWTSTAAAKPIVYGPHASAAVNGLKSDGLELSFGLSILANALAAFGASVPSLDASFKTARSIQFSYTNVTSTSVDAGEVGNYLVEGSLRVSNPVVQSYFFGADALAYLIVEVLKSDAVTVSATDSNGVDVDLHIPALEGVLGSKIGVKPASSSSSGVTFTGAAPLTFGFKVMQLNRVGASGLAPVFVAASGDLAFAVPGIGVSSEDDAGGSPVFDTGDFDCRIDI